MNTMIEVDNVTKRFGGLVAVNAVTIHVDKGEIYGLIGPNGAGKTTLVNVIAGVYKPDIGKIRMDGKDVSGMKPFQLCHLGLSRTYQIAQGFSKLTALENVMVALTFGGAKIDRHKRAERAQELLDYVQFPLPGDTLAQNLNTVQLKRLDLARALANNCKVLLLDELASGLTPTELNDLVAIIRKINDSGVTILIIEHVLKFIVGLCDRIMVLSFGEKIAEGTPDEVMNNVAVQDAYLGKDYTL